MRQLELQAEEMNAPREGTKLGRTLESSEEKVVGAVQVGGCAPDPRCV